MSIRIELYIVVKADLVQRLVAAGAVRTSLLFEILEECGETIGSSYILLDNEYYDDGNPYYSLFELLDAAFPELVKNDGSGSHDVFLQMRLGRPGVVMRGTNYVDAVAVANTHGIDLKMEET